MQVCVLCNNSYDPRTVNLEQKLVDDKDFCSRCWNDFMNSDKDKYS